ADNAATTYKNLNKEDITRGNLAQDIPYLLDQTPSVVIGSDAGAGVGYTNLTVRGSDNQRINVTLNGIPLNDARSEEHTSELQSPTRRSSDLADNAATTYKNLNKEDITRGNLAQDIPYLLDQTPSVVIGSDAGAGVGYTNLTVRGSDNQRINVTLNGIPLNDAESMGSFFVNLPDFASSAESIQ